MDKQDFNHYLKQDILTINNIVNLFEDAARTERFISKPRHPGAPTMYDILITSYDKADIDIIKSSLSQEHHLTDNQVEFAIDMLMLVDKDIVDNPIEIREMIWMQSKNINGLD